MHILNLQYHFHKTVFIPQGYHIIIIIIIVSLQSAIFRVEVEALQSRTYASQSFDPVRINSGFSYVFNLNWFRACCWRLALHNAPKSGFPTPLFPLRMYFNQPMCKLQLECHWLKGNLYEFYFTFNARVPAPYIKPCARSDPNINECAVKHGNEAIPHVLKGKFYKAGSWGARRGFVLETLWRLYEQVLTSFRLNRT